MPPTENASPVRPQSCAHLLRRGHHSAVVRANGLTVFYEAENYWFADDDKYQLQAGDQILVLPKIDTKLLQAVKDITQIVYQIAIAANVVK